MRSTSVALASTLVVGALITAGCGSSGSSGSSTASNGEASKTGTQVLADAKAATQAATSVHVALTGLSATVTSAALDLSRGTGASGTLTFKGQPVQIVVSGQTVYMKGSAAFWTQATGSASSAKLFADKWLKVPASTASSAVSDMSSLTDMTTFFTGLLSPSGSVTNAGLATFDGTSAVKLTNGKAGALYIAATGSPLPLGVTQPAAQGAGKGSFTNWNAPVTITVPAGAIDLPQG